MISSFVGTRIHCMFYGLPSAARTESTNIGVHLAGTLQGLHHGLSCPVLRCSQCVLSVSSWTSSYRPRLWDPKDFIIGTRNPLHVSWIALSLSWAPYPRCPLWQVPFRVCTVDWVVLISDVHNVSCLLSVEPLLTDLVCWEPKFPS